MSTTAELRDTHLPAARVRYAAAVTELRAAYGELGAIERWLTNKNVGGLASVGMFGPARPDPISLRHPIAAPTVGGSFEDDIQAALTTIKAAWPTPDE